MMQMESTLTSVIAEGLKYAMVCAERVTAQHTDHRERAKATALYKRLQAAYDAVCIKNAPYGIVSVRDLQDVDTILDKINEAIASDA